MAKIKLNPVLEQMRGKVGDLVFKRVGDEVIVGRAPDTEGREPTPAQAAHRERFRLAVLYGRTVLADPAAKAIYAEAAEAKGTRAFALTVADFLNAPAVDEIDLSAYTGKTGEIIRVLASDDFEVTGVRVRLADENGATLEEGDAAATVPDGWEWKYTAQADVSAGQQVAIEVTAADRPGHKATGAATKTV